MEGLMYDLSGESRDKMFILLLYRSPRAILLFRVESAPMRRSGELSVTRSAKCLDESLFLIKGKPVV